MLDNVGWQVFCKTGDIDAYLLYKTASPDNSGAQPPQTMVETGNGTNADGRNCPESNGLQG